MSASRLTCTLALATLFVPSAVLACLWDHDTLLQERSRFPDALELITGKFLRHSYEFYHWRIEDRLRKLKADPDNLAYLDDLAVAYEKTGQHQQAIDTMLAADKKRPGRYETEANLGTFYIHAGRPEEGLVHIDAALRINPNAHFGREKYQRLLVEYVIACREGGDTPLPLAGSKKSVAAFGLGGFGSFLTKKQGLKGLTEPGRAEAIRGVLGMMRFGDFESPVLLEALASLLRQPGAQPDQDANRLAARAYLKASYVAPGEAAKKAYRACARGVLSFQTAGPLTNDRLPLEEVEAAFQGELAEARQWYEGVVRDERTWIREGKDPEQEFARKYYEEPRVSMSLGERVEDLLGPYWPAYGVGAGLAVLLGGLFLLWRRRARARRTAGLHPAR